MSVSMTVADYLKCGFWADVEKNKKYLRRFTGFGNLDGTDGNKKFSFSFLPGLYILSGEPGAGKTSWALQLACQLSEGVINCEPEACVFVSYELSRQMLMCKIIAREMRIEHDKTQSNFDPPSATKIFCGARPPEFETAIERLRNCDLLEILEAAAQLTIDKLIDELRAMAAAADERNFVCVIDYLQLIPSGESDKSETSKERLDSILFKLKKFQQEVNATVILISSRNRQSNTQGGRDLFGFSGSGGIEYCADVALTLSRADGLSSDNLSKPPPYDVWLTCSKNRFGGLFKVGFSYWAQSDYFCRREADETAEKVSAKKERRK